MGLPGQGLREKSGQVNGIIQLSPSIMFLSFLTIAFAPIAVENINAWEPILVWPEFEPI